MPPALQHLPTVAASLCHLDETLWPGQWCFTFQGLICPEGGLPNTTSPMKLLIQADHPFDCWGYSENSIAGLPSSPPCFMCWGSSSRILYGGITDLGIGLVSAGCHLLAGNLGNSCFSAKFVPPHPRRVLSHPLQQQTCHQLLLCLVAAGSIAQGRGFLMPTTAPS